MIKSLPIIYAIGAAQAFILAIALWNKKVNILSNRILSVWLLLLCFDLTVKAIFLSNENKVFNFSYFLIQFFPFLYASSFYIYVRTLTSGQSLHVKDLIHFLAFLVFFIVNIPALFGLFNAQPLGLRYYNSILYASSISYVTAGLVVIFRYRKNLLLQKVDIAKINLNWLMIMGYSQIVIWLIALSQWLLPVKGYNEWTIYIAVSVWILLMGYLSHSQQTIDPISHIKTRKTVVDTKKFDNVKDKIEWQVSHNNIHLKPNLTIRQLAKVTGYPEYLISQYINRIHGMNFYDFINQLRIEHAKFLLQSNTKQTILDVAYACGYNSKSTFNSAFKKYTELTPSQFKQDHNS